jgi:hypothetical protein
LTNSDTEVDERDSRLAGAGRRTTRALPQHRNNAPMFAVTQNHDDRLGSMLRSFAMIALATLVGPAIGVGVFVVLNVS